VEKKNSKSKHIDGLDDFFFVYLFVKKEKKCEKNTN